MTAEKQVQIREEKHRGRATIIHVGVYEPGRHGLSQKREFYSVRQRKQAEEYAAWLRHCIDLAAAAKARNESLS
jgi:hypothetical protein